MMSEEKRYSRRVFLEKVGNFTKKTGKVLAANTLFGSLGGRGLGNMFNDGKDKLEEYVKDFYARSEDALRKSDEVVSELEDGNPIKSGKSFYERMYDIPKKIFGKKKNGKDVYRATPPKDYNPIIPEKEEDEKISAYGAIKYIVTSPFGKSTEADIGTKVGFWLGLGRGAYKATAGGVENYKEAGLEAKVNVTARENIKLREENEALKRGKNSTKAVLIIFLFGALASLVLAFNFSYTGFSVLNFFDYSSRGIGFFSIAGGFIFAVLGSFVALRYFF